MDFQFFDDEQKLTMPVNAGGCGLNNTDLDNVTRWQGDAGYVFNTHTGYHGSGDNQYIHIRSAQQKKGKDLQRIWVSGPRAGRPSGNNSNLSNRQISDACEVVSENLELFQTIVANINS